MTFIDKSVEVLLKLRWDKIQSISSYVVLFGISLIGFNFWNWAWDVFFERAGFQRDENHPAFFGLTLIVLGLATLVADKFARRITPPTFEQDKRIYNRSMELCPWSIIDWFLNDLHSYFFRKGHKSSLVDLVKYLQLEENAFAEPTLRSASEEMIYSANNLIWHLALNFTGPNAPNSEIIDWNQDKHVQFGEQGYEKMKEKADELRLLSDNFEIVYKQYQKAANKLGLVEAR